MDYVQLYSIFCEYANPPPPPHFLVESLVSVSAYSNMNFHAQKSGLSLAQIKWAGQFNPFYVKRSPPLSPLKVKMLVKNIHTPSLLKAFTFGHCPK